MLEGVPRKDFLFVDLMTSRWCEGNEKAAKSMRDDIIGKAREFAGACPNGLVQSLAVTAALCWYETQFRFTTMNINKVLTPASADARHAYLDRAMKRFERMMRTLAYVRKLGLPSIQVNIAHGPQQVVNHPGGAT
jgi:hypothetical protein